MILFKLWLTDRKITPQHLHKSNMKSNSKELLKIMQIALKLKIVAF